MSYKFSNMYGFSNKPANQGFPSARIKYNKNDTTVFVNVYNCVNEGGANFYEKKYIDNIGEESKGEGGYKKTIDFMDDKAIEGYGKLYDNYTLKCDYDQFIVVFDGQHMDISVLKTFAKKFILKSPIVK